MLFLDGEQLAQVAVSQQFCKRYVCHNIYIIRTFLDEEYFRQMLRLSQGAHATTYQPTEAESQIRWFAWASWQVELILARQVTLKNVIQSNLIN